MTENNPPFGTFAPTAFEQSVRRFTHRLPHNYVGRKLASLCLGPAGGRSGGPRDVSIFGDQKARLHPYDNISEKRVFVTPQFWDPRERATLAGLIRTAAGPVTFLDVGANAGLYALFARSAAAQAGVDFRALCIEPAPDMLARIRFNIAASGANAEITVSPFGVADAASVKRFSVNSDSRGMTRLDDKGSESFECKPLLQLMDEASIDRATAMKIDIEGAETAVLQAFFEAAPEARRPRHIFIEVAHAPEAADLLRRYGYREIFSNRQNGVYASPDAA